MKTDSSFLLVTALKNLFFYFAPLLLQNEITKLLKRLASHVEIQKGEGCSDITSFWLFLPHTAKRPF